MVGADLVVGSGTAPPSPGAVGGLDTCAEMPARRFGVPILGALRGCEVSIAMVVTGPQLLGLIGAEPKR